MAKWKLVSKHEYDFAGALPEYGLALITFGVGALLTAGGVATVIYFGDGEGVSRFLIGIPLLLFGLIALAAAWAIVPWKKVRWVKVYEEGVKWMAGGKEHKQRWEDATSVNRTEIDAENDYGQRSEMMSTAFVTLKFESGASVSLDRALSDYGRLADNVQKAVAARQVGKASQALAGKGKSFGPVHIARDGVTVNGKGFGWKEVKWLTVQNGHLCAHHRCGTWTPVPLSDIPNSATLIALLQEIGRFHE